MLNVTRHARNRVFIVSASLSEVVDTKINGLSFLARQSYYSRDYSRLATIGNELMSLSARSEDVGRYFYSIAEHRLGRKEFNKNEFEDLAGHSSQPVRAASHLALGLWALQERKSDEALLRFQESYKLATANSAAPLTAIHTASSASYLLSLKGSHKESLDILRMIHPVVCNWGQVFPFLLGEQFNNMAYEMLQLGHLSAARYAIDRACALPVARAYPEWFETRVEIEEKQREVSPERSAFLPVREEQKTAARYQPERAPVSPPDDSQKESNVLSFKRKRIEIWLKYKSYTHFLQQFSFDGEASVESFLVNLLQGIDDLRAGDSSSTLTIYTQLLESHDVKYETENFISKSNINGLFEHFDDLKLLLEVLADSAAEEVGSTAEQEVINQQLERIRQLVEADES